MLGSKGNPNWREKYPFTGKSESFSLMITKSAWKSVVWVETCEHSKLSCLESLNQDEWEEDDQIWKRNNNESLSMYIYIMLGSWINSAAKEFPPD